MRLSFFPLAFSFLLAQVEGLLVSWVRIPPSAPAPAAASRFARGRLLASSTIRTTISTSRNRRNVSRQMVISGSSGSNIADNDTIPARPPSSRPRESVLSSWISTGISTVYLIHFASLYTQLPGLFGRLLPPNNNSFMMEKISLPAIMEAACATGILVSALQLVQGWRRGWRGVLSYALLWGCWYSLVVTGGRFLEYQMDLLLLDVAPLTLLLAAGADDVAYFGLRWLLSRLYLGAGAVKLLSCDSSWRDLSAIYVHWQSQPLPNPVAAWAHQQLAAVPVVAQALTGTVLVWEMALPFLFLAPSRTIRRIAFTGNVLLMAGIAMFGDFGPLQLLLGIVGLALLVDDEDAEEDVVVVDDSIQGSRKSADGVEESEFAALGGDRISSSSSGTTRLVEQTLSIVSVALAAGATVWTVHNINSMCMSSWSVEPLVYDLAALGLVVAVLPPLLRGRFGTAALSLTVFAGSVASMANGLGVYLPFNEILEMINLGASPYHLFATMTGKTGRPVAFMEAAPSMEGPWFPVPFLYQVNDPARPLPFAFPHFPRLDWTIWFIPLGETGSWIARLFQGITLGDEAVVGLLDAGEFRKQFPTEPPAIVRVVPRIYEFNSSPGDHSPWRGRDDEHYRQGPVLATYTRGDQPTPASWSEPWPSLPVLRPLVAASGRPDHFVWGCLASAELARRTRVLVSEKSSEEECSDGSG